MILSEEVKLEITEEYNRWVNKQYGDTTQDERDELGAFFTPPPVTFTMLEKCESLEGDILDPCCGSGNLLAACVIAGADPNRIYGNEFDERFVKIARERLGELGVPWYHIHQGDATQKNALDKDSFTEDYKMHPDRPLYVQMKLW